MPLQSYASNDGMTHFRIATNEVARCRALRFRQKAPIIAMLNRDWSWIGPEGHSTWGIRKVFSRTNVVFAEACNFEQIHEACRHLDNGTRFFGCVFDDDVGQIAVRVIG